MTKIILILPFLACLLSQQLSAQAPEGVITYQVKINMHRNIPPEREQMKQMIPEFNIEEAQLFFNPQESYYEPVEPEPQAHADEGRRPAMRMRRPRHQVYLRQSDLKLISLREFMGKKYLIEDTLRMLPWKLGTETMEIHGYLCRKATLDEGEDKMKVVAWYTDALRPLLGPESFNTLPGAVLHVDINDGERLITATAIRLRPLEKDEIRIPNAKSKLTEPEYREMVKSQIERMRANGRNVIIRN